MARRYLTTWCPFLKKYRAGRIWLGWAGRAFPKNALSLRGDVARRRAHPLILTAGPGQGGTRLSAAPARHAGASVAASYPAPTKLRREPDAALAGLAADCRHRPGGCPWPPREWGRALHCAVSEGGGHGHREVGERRRPGVRPASSPLADEDGDEAASYHSENRHA